MPSQFTEALELHGTAQGRKSWLNRIAEHMDDDSYADLCAAMANRSVPAPAIFRTLMALDLPDGTVPTLATVKTVASSIRSGQ